MLEGLSLLIFIFISVVTVLVASRMGRGRDRAIAVALEHRDRAAREVAVFVGELGVVARPDGVHADRIRRLRAWSGATWWRGSELSFRLRPKLCRY